MMLQTLPSTLLSADQPGDAPGSAHDEVEVLERSVRSTCFGRSIDWQQAASRFVDRQTGHMPTAVLFIEGLLVVNPAFDHDPVPRRLHGPISTRTGSFDIQTLTPLPRSAAQTRTWCANHEMSVAQCIGYPPLGSVIVKLLSSPA